MTRKPQILPILTNPDPFLRKPVDEVENVDKPEIQRLIDDMIVTMKQDKGVGLAAIQVGYNGRLIVIDTKDGPIVLINPELTDLSKETEIAEEGCLSVPETYGLVKRSTEATVKALDRKGEVVEYDAVGLFARVLQHEVDHLNGILFIDKLETKTEKL